jgi:hypothetical protein
VQVQHLLQGDVVPLCGQGTRHFAVVVRVLLGAPDGDRRRDRDRVLAVVQRLTNEPGDPGVAHEAALLRVVARHEEAARLQEERADRAWEAALRVQHRQAAERGAHRRGSADDPVRVAQRRHDVVRQHARVGGRGRVPLVAVAGREQRDAVRGQLTGGDLGRAEAGQL